MSAAQNPFGFAAPPAGNPAPQPPQYGQPQYQQQQQQPPPQQQYSQPPQQQQQLVVAAQPSNPYAGIVAPPPPQQQQASPWDAPAAVAPAPQFAAPPAANPFDPFAAPPPPAPVAQAPPQQNQHQQSYPAAPIQDPWGSTPTPTQNYSAPQQQQQYHAPAPVTNETQVAPVQQPQPYQPSSSYPSDNNYASYGNNDNSRQMVPSSNNNDSNYEDKDQRNPYGAGIPQQVSGQKASGLPKPELVGKKGFVLSRISFRTIVMKKWKQSFWVQYGGHTMLWFRAQQDFNDWLNNPYHTQFQRNFLIKLAINFVHDLYKPNVRGYQVTQCRTKPYNNKIVRQFKLERWMDYGPTIAAAFGSFDPKEVDACREAIVECMKNTPLDNGIRATGAVKEHHEQKQQEEWRKTQNGAPNGGGYKNYSMSDVSANGANPTEAPRSTSMPDFDLLGDNDVGAGALVPAVNPHAAYPGAPPPQAGNTIAQQQPAFYPTSSQQPPQYPAQPPAPPAYGAQAGAPTPQAYPGQQQQQQQEPQYQQQQQQYPVQAPAPGFAQPPQTEYGGYPYQQQQQPGAGGYPAASYPVPTQQF